MPRPAQSGAVLCESIVDEYAVVVRVNAFDGEGQLPSDGFQSCHYQGLLPGQQRHRFSPAGADIGGHQAVDHGTPQRAAVVDDQVNLQESRWRRIPIGEGPHRYIAARRLLPPSSEPAARRCPDGLEQPVQGSGAGRQQPLANLRVQTQVAAALHGLHQVGRCCPQSLAADPVSSFPNHDQRLTNRLVVDPSAPFYRRLLRSVIAGLPQQPDAMVAMVAGHRDELVQDPAFLPLG